MSAFIRFQKNESSKLRVIDFARIYIFWISIYKVCFHHKLFRYYIHRPEVYFH